MNNITKISDAEFYAAWEDLDFFCHALNMCKKSLENDEDFWAEVLADPNQKIACVRGEDND